MNPFEEVEPKKVKLDAPKLIKDLGGIHDIAVFFEKRNTPVPLGTVKQWRTRGSIPGDKAILLICEMLPSVNPFFTYKDYVKEY